MRLLAISDGGTYVDLPPPSTYSALPQSIDKAGRNVNADLYREIINTKFAIQVSWNAISPADKNTVMLLTKNKEFNVRYFDLTDSTFKYGRFYRGNDLAITPLVRWDPNRNEFVAYKIDTFSLTEY